MRFADDWVPELAVYEAWIPYIEKLDAELEALIPGYEVHQVKDKFGGLRYYFEVPAGTPDDVAAQAQALAHRYESESYTWPT